MIKKQWCTYSFESSRLPYAVGKIVQEDSKYVDILYLEHQHYPPTLWDLNYIKRFDKLEEAIAYWWVNRPGVDNRGGHDWTLNSYIEHIEYCFSDYKIDKTILHNEIETHKILRQKEREQ